MRKTSILITLIAGLCLAGGAYAGPIAKMASQIADPPHDPKKKKAGEECKTSDECQVHHSCKIEGDKGICTAPPRHKMPPGAVT